MFRTSGSRLAAVLPTALISTCTIAYIIGGFENVLPILILIGAPSVGVAAIMWITMGED